jgi:23S rRNA (cytidine1920-2'-O)/16S rRNA (cytidine1409-2'-O)-methyltransferase
VINLERTNLGQLDRNLIGEPVELITMDLSYLAVADAIGQVDRRLLAPATQLIALIKPTFELHAATLADQPQQVAAAVRAAARGLAGNGWQVLGQQPSPIRGPKGAVEVLVHATSGSRSRAGQRPVTGAHCGRTMVALSSRALLTAHAPARFAERRLW